MTDQQREHLSAFVDGEIDEPLLQPTISALEASSDLANTWERYHLIGQAMRGEAVRADYRKVSARVNARIAEEPVTLKGTFGRRHRASRMGPFVGAALAASAAFFAVFAVPQLFNPGPSSPKPAVAVSTPIPPHQFELARSGQRWNLEEPRLQSKMDRFLVNHQAYAPSSGIKGFLPYATVVGYEAGR